MLRETQNVFDLLAAQMALALNSAMKCALVLLERPIIFELEEFALRKVAGKRSRGQMLSRVFFQLNGGREGAHASRVDAPEHALGFGQVLQFVLLKHCSTALKDHAAHVTLEISAKRILGGF